MRILCLIYLTPCFVINDADQAIKYYRSIYWAYHILLIILTVVAAVLYKTGHQPQMPSVGKSFPPRPKVEISNTAKPVSTANIMDGALDIVKNRLASSAVVNKADNVTESRTANAPTQSSDRSSGPTKPDTNIPGGTDKPDGKDKSNRPNNPGGPSIS